MTVTEEIVRVGSLELQVLTKTASQLSTNSLVLLGADGFVIDSAVLKSFYLSATVDVNSVDLVWSYANRADFADEYEDLNGATPVATGTPTAKSWTVFTSRFIRTKIKSTTPGAHGTVTVNVVLNLK